MADGTIALEDEARTIATTTASRKWSPNPYGHGEDATVTWRQRFHSIFD